MSRKTTAMPIELTDAELDEVSGGGKTIVFGNIGYGGHGVGGVIVKPVNYFGEQYNDASGNGGTGIVVN
jgi:hypothetical protein